MRRAFGFAPRKRSMEYEGYVRRGPFLNLICRGEGGESDPNLSLYLSARVKQALGRKFPVLTRG